MQPTLGCSAPVGEWEYIYIYIYVHTHTPEVRSLGGDLLFAVALDAGAAAEGTTLAVEEVYIYIYIYICI